MAKGGPTMADKSMADELNASCMILGKEGYDSVAATWRKAIKIIHDLEAENAKLREEMEEAIKREMNTVMRLEMSESALQLANANLALALEQRNKARRNQCELEAMVNEPEGFPAERKAWRDRAKRRYAEEAWPGSAAELWPESET
jgi:DNA repair exonuclease SbcCD ATPase subunit